MRQFKFTATLKHDNGQFNLTVIASTIKQAINLICNAEGCPERAIQRIKIKAVN